MPSEWEYKQLVKYYNNPHDSSPSVNILLSEKLLVCTKQIHHEDIFLLQTIPFGSNMSPLSIILFSPVKNGLIQIKGEICANQALFTSENSPKHR